MPAIKAVNSRNLKVINCKFSGFDTDIELENVDGFVSQNNQFSGEKVNPQFLIKSLAIEIKNSKLDNASKERLFKETIEFLARKNSNKESIKLRILKYAGNKAVDFCSTCSSSEYRANFTCNITP